MAAADFGNQELDNQEPDYRLAEAAELVDQLGQPGLHIVDEQAELVELVAFEVELELHFEKVDNHLSE